MTNMLPNIAAKIIKIIKIALNNINKILKSLFLKSAVVFVKLVVSKLVAFLEIVASSTLLLLLSSESMKTSLSVVKFIVCSTFPFTKIIYKQILPKFYQNIFLSFFYCRILFLFFIVLSFYNFFHFHLEI